MLSELMKLEYLGFEEVKKLLKCISEFLDVTGLGSGLESRESRETLGADFLMVLTLGLSLVDLVSYYFLTFDFVCYEDLLVCKV